MVDQELFDLFDILVVKKIIKTNKKTNKVEILKEAMELLNEKYMEKEDVQREN